MLPRPTQNPRTVKKNCSGELHCARAASSFEVSVPLLKSEKEREKMR